MRLEQIKILNYKSIGEEITLNIEKDRTILIGENESGKTNILSCIKEFIDKFYTDNYFYEYNDYNKEFLHEYYHICFKYGIEKFNGRLLDNGEYDAIYNISEDPNKIRLEYLSDKKPIEIFAIPYINVIYKNNQLYFDTRDFVDLLESEFKESLDEPYIEHNIEEIFERYYFDEVEEISLNYFKSYYLKNQYCLDINYLRKIMINDKNFWNSFSESKVGEIVYNYIYYIYIITNFYFTSINEKAHLWENIELIKVSDNLNVETEKDIIDNMFKICLEDKDDILNKIIKGKDDDKRNILSRINKEIEVKIKDKLINYYTLEKIDFELLYENNEFTLYVNSITNNGNKKYIKYSDRSDGFKSIFNLFILVTSIDKLKDNSILLIDEVGKNLHPRGQKEVLKFLEKLSLDYQIIYSTHSPFMIDETYVDKIRGIYKDENGFTKVLNNVYSNKQLPSKNETLSPLLNAIGMDMGQNIGLDTNFKNIIVEGITDAIYLRAYNEKYKKDSYKFIASIGADNIISIIKILLGWGYEYTAIFDGDTKGKRCKQKLDGNGINNYFLLSDIFEEENFEIENLIVEDDYKKLGYDKNFARENDNKKIVACAFRDSLLMNKDDKFDLSEETKKNFEKLFSKISEQF